MVKINRLWGKAGFARLEPTTKLLYLYLVSQPSITTLGVLELSQDKIFMETGLIDIDLVFSVKELQDKGYLFHKKEDGFEVFIIRDHFLSLSKSKLNIRKAIDEGKSSKYREDLVEIYEPQDFQTSSFVPPEPEEVTEYALSLGHVVNGRTFVEHYSENDWYDNNNKQVRNWKAKVKKVWCREDNKLKLVDGAPEGFEYFYILDEKENRISPEGWRDGKPTHSNYLYADLLKQEFNKCITKQQEST